ncbi:hypothetical protein GobsT_75120 [Gemmata obscuriglobus]|uniref:DUF1501 domain-containing protein n=1 Tax=Gemmata obscuriglobus TaxID=114 RepID=A0A2Z3HIZ3_9BACT|nr:DUF1501 domain-containing protein [Gemmata obscuriglobus]AWM41440.1 DUF1501 domain-containing protein [Gemmata obscuriglobus]QEG32654.1 hypothetical protein GobsT_75120 [Gemmata obscuriglobus]VTS12010.1 secreted protein containing duf1501 : Uncharacterized protein OS=Pirellula staleyi (strain ATCC 27377 / DSM 6068 / ICPB 4128) GN=Psta_4048 PE=4 SV=1: DUF1501 [Gemmata obscuriglobus UQM 2246]
MLPNRRDFFCSASALGATAALHLLAGAKPHHAPKAKRAIQISLVGGLSHLDSFDYKPDLTRLHGKALASDTKPDVFFGQVGLLRKPDWEFKRRGKSGLWVSELFPHLAGVADELTVINSMTADSANHTPALFVLNSGFQFNGYPALGAWLSYGLGSEAEDLPAFVVLPDGRGDANGAASNWSSGFLPAQHQGVIFRGGDAPVRDLFPEKPIPAGEESASRAALDALNVLHLQRSGNEDALAARMQSYALAAKMQLAVPAVADLSKESAKLKSQYGLDDPKTADCGRRCLLARRLLEKGVRFVQVYSGGPIAGTPRTSWDAHENVLENHGAEAARIDRPVAALIQDLKQKDMLKDTLVLFTTEFGRTPFTQSAGNVVGTGRDHNKYGFTCWLAGAGCKPGTAFGSTDDIGWKASEHPVAWHDFHATVLHLLGIDHEKLTFYHNGINRRLTNVHGEVVKGVLA